MSENKMGPYLLQGVVGRGGMGTVYKAQHDSTGEIVAIKALSPTYSNDSHFRSRFESEIQALLKLDHPNIVRLLSFGQEDGNLYFAMELVEGKSLFHHQKSGVKFDWRDAIMISRDVASGLRHAHDRGIIHRDLKPGNLIRSTNGVVKITDFGIAKEFGADHNTRDNVLGTLDFMSPEQAKGQPVTIRSDLFSLGVVIYTLLSGKPPFSANSMEESLRNLTSVPAPQLSSVSSGVPDELDSLISQLIKKRPDDRIPTAQVFLNKLKEVEHKLKHYSEAKTAHGVSESDEPSESLKPSSGTKIKTLSDKGLTEGLFVPTRQGKNLKPKSPTVHEKTIEHKSGEVVPREDDDFESGDVESPDYFNPVTDNQRKFAVGETDEDKASPWKSAIPIMVALFVVLALAIFGITQALKKPSADQLYEAIAASEQKPNKVRSEINDFLERFPEDDRVEEIRGLEKVASAMAYINRMKVRNGMSGENRLSKMERELIKIVKNAEDDSVEGFSQLMAFVNIHKTPEEADDDQVACFKAAENYLVKLRNDAENQLDWYDESIDAALQRAAESKNPVQQEEIYESIIELYGKTEWAKPKVDIAKGLLDDLKK
jgi:serine/threonine-protein kinase